MKNFKITLLIVGLTFFSCKIFAQTQDLSNKDLKSIPTKYWSKNLQQMNITGNTISGSEIVLFNLSSPKTTVIYSGVNNKVDTLSAFKSNNLNYNELITSLKEKKLGTIVQMASYYHNVKQSYLVIGLYKLTDSMNIDYKTRIKIINTIYQNNQNYAASSVADKVVKDTTIKDINEIKEIADIFEKKELYPQSISMYSRIGYNNSLKNTSQSLFALYSIAGILEKNEKNDSTIRLYQIYEDVCFATPKDEESLNLVKQGCKKCFDKAQTELPYLKNLYTKYAEKKEKRIKAGATTKTIGSIIGTVTSIGGSFIPGVGGVVTGLAGQTIDASTGLAGSLLDDTRKLDRIMRLIDNQIAKLINRQKSLMTKIEIDQKSLNGYNDLVTKLGIDIEMPYVEIPTQYSSFIDERDKQVYRTVKIGNTWWMLDELMFKTKNSERIKTNKKSRQYGIMHDYTLYYIEDAIKACPTGWSVPDSTDWNNLINNVGGSKYALNYLNQGGLVDFNLYFTKFGDYMCNDSIAYSFTKEDVERQGKWGYRKGLREGGVVYPTMIFYYNNTDINYYGKNNKIGLTNIRPTLYLNDIAKIITKSKRTRVRCIKKD